jgi:hypothetical protein
MRSLQGRRCGSSDMLHNRHACCGFAAFYSLGFVLRSGREAQNHLRHPVATIIAGILFSQETKNVGEIKGSEAVRFLRFISGSCEGLLVGHSLHKECAKDDIFLASNK